MSEADNVCEAIDLALKSYKSRATTPKEAKAASLAKWDLFAAIALQLSAEAEEECGICAYRFYISEKGCEACPCGSICEEDVQNFIHQARELSDTATAVRNEVSLKDLRNL